MTSTASREWQDRHPPTPAVVQAFARATWRMYFNLLQRSLEVRDWLLTGTGITLHRQRKDGKIPFVKIRRVP